MTPAGTRALATTNRFLIPLLHSTAGGRLGRRLAVVVYSGRRTGVDHRLVVGYRVDGTTVHIRVGRADHKTWWRNFETPHPVRLLLAGVSHEAVAHVVHERDQVSVVAELVPFAAQHHGTGSTDGDPQE